MSFSSHVGPRGSADLRFRRNLLEFIVEIYKVLKRHENDP